MFKNMYLRTVVVSFLKHSLPSLTLPFSPSITLPGPPFSSPTPHHPHSCRLYQRRQGVRVLPHFDCCRSSLQKKMKWMTLYSCHDEIMCRRPRWGEITASSSDKSDVPWTRIKLRISLLYIDLWIWFCSVLFIASVRSRKQYFVYRVFVINIISVMISFFIIYFLDKRFLN